MLSNMFCKNIHYMKYYKLRPILFDIYNNKNISNTTLEHIIPQSIYKKKDKILCRDLHNIIFKHNIIQLNVVITIQLPSIMN